MFRGLFVLMVQDWWRPWNCCVLQTDASESGWGMAQSFWPKMIVEQVGRVPERARFRSALGRPARESALAAANLSLDGAGAWRVLDDGKNLIRSRPTSCPSGSSTPILMRSPGNGSEKGAWETVRSGVWRFSEGILILEARALVKSIQPAAGQDLARSLCATALPIRQYVCGSFFRQGSFVLLQFAGADPSILRVRYRVGALARYSMDPLGV